MTKQLKKFGTFAGVFTPTILTIVGVIMYLRLGWVIGSVGLSGALIIIGLAHVATITTALSLSSMATNAKIGAGGFYALVSRSLGPEIGGAIGIPLYLSQTLGTALYIIGFTEAWLSIFPEHSSVIIGLIVLVTLLLISYFGADLAMKFQFVIMAVIALSLVSFFASKHSLTQEINLSFSYVPGKFWEVFAVFFPAVTGIGAGAAMSGDLKNPSKSLPIGILGATFVGLTLYCVVAFWYAGMATPDELTNNYMIMSIKSKWEWLVLAGIMGATLSSALGSLVAAPRILFATAQDHVIPFSKTFAVRSKKGDPKNSILLTGFLVLASLQLGNLNVVASLLTMFFLISYAMINISLFIEIILKIPSFRPTLKIPVIVPFIGSIWCIAIMFLISPPSAVGSLIFIGCVYFFNVKRNIQVSFSDIRSGLFNAIAEWAVKKSFKTRHHKKSWKPNILLPIESPKEFTEILSIIDAIVVPSGTIRVVSVSIKTNPSQSKLTKFIRKSLNIHTKKSMDKNHLEGQLNHIASHFKGKKLLVTTTVAEATNLIDGIRIIIQTIKGLYLPPNLICLRINPHSKNLARIEEVTSIAEKEKLGVILITNTSKRPSILNEKSLDTTVALNTPKPSSQKSANRYINVWLRSESPNLNLALLLAIQIQKNWKCNIRLISSIEDLSIEKKTQSFHKHLIDSGRLQKTESKILVGNFFNLIETCPKAELNIFGAKGFKDYSPLKIISTKLDSTCLFVKDSGQESAFA
ncbi:hypothetical protein HOH45_07040 [bacterium]|jgi:solute carrier family 12 (sodium/potassium/chloride transporter), member 2|nr:hypothetical protein [bacterium]